MRRTTALALPVCTLSDDCLGLSPAILLQFILEVCTIAENRKKMLTLKHPILGAQGHSRSSTLIPLKSSSPLPDVISSMSMPICNYFRVHGRADIGKKNFLQQYPYLTLACSGFLEPKRSGLRLLKSTFDAKNFVSSIRGTFGLSPAISVQFTFKMCVQREIAKSH